ncbi:YjfB family protein [Lacrimispora indolis]|uniref:YjfB family protein n=1 Tax=Lacrimispora indolis TaxID=69825 RepID=UPI00045EA13B|nr:YjfB family protein [Lacrimispora indolis]
MDIGAISMEMSLARVQQSAGINVAKKAIDSQELAAAGLLQMADAAVSRQPPTDGIGQFVNVRA